MQETENAEKGYSVEYDHKTGIDTRIACVRIGAYRAKITYDSLGGRCNMRAAHVSSMLAPGVLLLGNGAFQLHYDYVLASDDSLDEFEAAYADAKAFCTEGKAAFREIVRRLEAGDDL